MNLKPLNPHVGSDDASALNLMSQVVNAVEKVRNGRRLELSAGGSKGTVRNERNFHNA